MLDTEASIFADMPAVVEREVADVSALDSLLKEAKAPFVVRGICSDWPLVKAGLQSAREARAYLLERARAVQFAVNIGAPGHDGRLFYDAGMQMNFRMAHGKLADIFGGFDANEGRRDPPCVYLSSIDVPMHFDGVHENNLIDLGSRDPRVSLWIGTPTRIAAHNDFPDNLACCVAGHRRFTIFPPEQFSNLYLGPIDNTPAGRAVSMVDFHKPDLGKYPKFSEALQTAQVAELEPGDAVFIPSMWWHHVEGLDPFNILLNYWWRDTPKHLGQPQDALYHAIMSVRDLPENEKKLWRDLFDHYVFGNAADTMGHIPDDALGILGSMTAENSSKIRTFLLRALNQ